MSRVCKSVKSIVIVVIAHLFAHFDASAEEVSVIPIDRTPYKIRCAAVDCTVFTGKDGKPLPAGEGSVECPYYKTPIECCATLPPEELLKVCKDPFGMYCQDCEMKCECTFWNSGKFYKLFASQVSFAFCPSLTPPSQEVAGKYCVEPCKKVGAAAYGSEVLPPWISLSSSSSLDMKCKESHRIIVEEVKDVATSEGLVK